MSTLYLIELQMLEHGPMFQISLIWVENQDYWIERTKYIEDKLSDRCMKN